MLMLKLKLFDGIVFAAGLCVVTVDGGAVRGSVFWWPSGVQ